MNVFFDGYTIINERPPENGLKVFSAKHDQTSKPVIIYFLPIDQKSPLLQKNIYHDYLPLRKIISKHVVRVYDIEEIDEPTASGIVFIREDISGIRLKEYINKKTHIPVDRFLNIALQLVTAICDLHQNGFIHKRLTSSSIVIDPDLIHVSIRDFNFGKSSLLDQTLLIRKDKEKTRAADELIYYISPEQTGRMNRAVDYRTDFYSLGIIFYELLCGTLPFIDENPIKIFHSHMAQKPAPPAEVRNDVDDAVSQIIMKLLSKSPEDRYQSGYGIKYDLNVCFQQFSAHSRIQPFAPASKDISEVFRIPEKIYGRDSEISRLADKYSQIKQGQLGFTVITGPSGIGKTRLIHEFRKYIVNSGGYFISGRYEKNQQNIPYSALIQAFNELIRQILTESSDHIHDWRQKLSTALGVNAQVLIDIFPDLELIIGKQPVVSELSPSDSLNRLHMVFDKFIQVFASKKHPLTLFIDDMQWADSDGLKLMEAFFAGTKSRYFYSISAYTNNGIIKQHQLVQSLDIINNKGIHIHNVILEPITEIDVCQLIADILQEKINNVKLLAKIVHNKTRGNPFFIRQLLHSLNDKDLLSYNCKTGRWQWNIEQIAAATISDKMIDFMTAKHIKELTDNAQHILKLAACIGNRFNISDLSIIAGKSQNEILADLWEAIELGFVKTKGDIYQHLFKPSGKIQASAGSKFEAADDIYFDFLHDRVRQTVYSHITDGQKNKLHHHIGKRILENTDQADLPNKFFFIINHLNYGKSLFSTPKNRYELAHLNFLAGTKANKSGAHRQAQVFLLTGEELLSDDAWDANHALNFELKKHRMECEYLLQNFNEGENLFQILLDHATSDEDRAGICNRKMIMLAGLARHEDALNIGLAGLSLLGVSLPRNAGRLDILRSLIGTKFRFNRRDIDSLLKLPVIEDPRLLLTLKILTNLTFSAFLCQPYLAPYLGLKIFKLTLKYGNSFFSPFAYVIYGASLCGIFRDYNTGYKFGKLSLKANKKFGGAEMTAKLLLYFGTVINIWTNHMHQGIAHNRRGVKTALETGDINYTVYHIQSLLMFLTAGGKRLDEIAEECDRYYKFVERSKDSGALNYLISLKQFVKCLKGKTFHHCSIEDKHFKETLHIKNMERDDIKIILFRHYLIKLRLLYITGDHEGALKAAHRCKSLQQYHIGAIVIPEYYFYHALALTAKCQTSSILKQKKYLRKAKYFCNKLKKLSHTCPENFMDKYLLVAAEIAKIYKKDQQAMTFYHHAIISAHNNNFTQNHAIANEAAAKFYISKGFENLAKTFMDNAIRSYRKWGATIKVDQLSKDFENIIISDSVIPTIPGKQHIDFHSIVKSLQMISTEIVLENLLKNLMKIVLENSGARKAQLLTVKSEKMFLEVENNMDSSKTKRYKSTPAENRNELFHPILNYVKRTQKYFVSDDISKEIDFINNSYFKRFQPKSVLCLPVIRHSQLVGLLYLENDIATSAFTTERIVVLQLLASQAAISLENARLYENVIHNEKEIRKISAEREEESISYQAQLRSLSSELSLTEEHERRKIAIDLHDRIGHTLTDASIKMRLIKNKEHSPDFPAKFEKIHSLINRSIQEARSLSFELSPPILYDLGLEAALDWLAEQTQNQHDIEVKFIDDMTDKPMNEDRSILLFQASRELLFNIVKHSRATKAIVSISKEENNIRIEIKDNGIGFEASRQDSNFKNGGFGLFSIRERINHQGGRLEIKDEPGVGSRVTMISPLKSI